MRPVGLVQKMGHSLLAGKNAGNCIGHKGHGSPKILKSRDESGAYPLAAMLTAVK